MSEAKPTPKHLWIIGIITLLWFYNFGLSDGMEVMGVTGLIFTVVIFFVALGLVLFSRAMRIRDVLS